MIVSNVTRQASVKLVITVHGDCRKSHKGQRQGVELNNRKYCIYVMRKAKRLQLATTLGKFVGSGEKLIFVFVLVFGSKLVRDVVLVCSINVIKKKKLR